jgi:hypothetical protein
MMEEEEVGIVPGRESGPPGTWHAVRFLLPDSFGRGKVVRAQLTSPSGVHYSDPIIFDYMDPKIQAGGLLLIDNPLAGSGDTEWDGFEYKLYVYGSNFGRSEEFVSGAVYIDGVAAKVYAWSHELVEVFTDAGAGEVVVQVGERMSEAEYYELFAPYLSARSTSMLEHTLFHTEGGEKLEIYGTDFGEVGVSITVGGEECVLEGEPERLETNGEVEYKVSCLVPEGQGTRNSVKVYRGFTLPSANDAFLAYYPPSVSEARDATTGELLSTLVDGRLTIVLPTSGAMVRLVGNDFGE